MPTLQPTPFAAPAPRRDLRLQIPVSTSEHLLVRELAAREGMTAAALMRRLIAERLAAEPVDEQAAA